jgi:hypothetical protein
MTHHFSLVVNPTRAMKGTPNMLKARHLRTGEDPVINDQLARTMSGQSGHQIMSLLKLKAQNALLVDNATE